MAKKPSGLTTRLLQQLDPLTSALRGARADAGPTQPKRKKKKAKAKTADGDRTRPKAKGADRKKPGKGASKNDAGQSGKTSKKKSAGLPVSPLAPKAFPPLPLVAGVQLGTTKTGAVFKRRTDLMVAALARTTEAAGVFTSSNTPGAPVEWCRNLVDPDQGMVGARALVVNAGNANVFTGQTGRDAVRAMAAAAAESMSCRQKDVLIASTGVIGEPLPVDKIVPGIGAAYEEAVPGGWQDAAQAIMTTDTFPKGSGATAIVDGKPVNICGIAKGSGMIAPNMATMLAFIFTDASIPASVLQTLLSVHVRHSFNSISVDGDESTSDTVLLFATGQVAAEPPIVRVGDRRLRDFRDKLSDVMEDLARQIVRDGEGASKFVTITVCGASTPRSARNLCLSVANSPLVKTAIAGSDANWGRIVMALGKAGEPLDPAKLCIGLGGHEVAKAGSAVTPFPTAAANRHLKGQEIEIEIDVGVGNGEATIWTCDLTHGYVAINADYRS